QEDDLKDREVDRREEMPQAIAQPGWQAEGGRSGAGRRDDGRASDGSSSETAPSAGADRAAAAGAARRGSGSGRSTLTSGCYTGVARCSDPGMGTPVTRSLPARFDAYIAPSALMISSSAVRPSSG